LLSDSKVDGTKRKFSGYTSGIAQSDINNQLMEGFFAMETKCASNQSGHFPIYGTMRTIDSIN